ncbi:MAG: carboxymuconolactone decarboxylase family protein [Cyclonatronaceae bacterium]
MRPFEVPTRDNVTEQNQHIFDDLKAKVGFVPNIYATYAYSRHALGRYLTFANGKTSLSSKEKEAINLVTSEVNGCTYCQAAHTQLGKMNGFTDEQILDLRQGRAPFDEKLDTLVNLAGEIAETRGKVSENTLEEFLDAGYTRENLIDVIVNVGEKATTNFLHNVTQIPNDFPEVPELAEK